MNSINRIVATAVLGIAVVSFAVESADKPVARVVAESHPMLKGDSRVPAYVAERASRIAQAEFDLSGLFPPRGCKGECPPVSGVTVEVEPFPGDRYLLEGRMVTGAPGGVWTWSADIADSEAGEAHLTINRGTLFGTLDTGTVHFTFLTDRNGRGWVREDDPNQYPSLENDEAIWPSPGPKNQTKAPNVPFVTGTTTLEVLVLYTASVEGRYDLYSLVANAAADMDASFSNTGITGNINIVGYQASTFDEDTPGAIGGTYLEGTLIPALTGSTSPFVGLNTMRDNLNADLVVLLYDSSYATDTCGAAYPLTDSVTNPNGHYDIAYSAIGDGCISAFNSFAHEIGHNMGGRHDYLVTPNFHDYGHGYTRSTAPTFRTVMGSGNGCSMSGCARINQWSAPGVNYSGVATGVSGQSDMKDLLNGTSNTSTLKMVADYETHTGSAPGQPGTTTVTNMVCYGFNEVSWGASSGNVGWYEIELSTSGSYTSPYTVYRGSATDPVIDVPATRYVRAKACNGNGCSSWRNGNTTATYYAGCA